MNIRVGDRFSDTLARLTFGYPTSGRIALKVIVTSSAR